MTFVLTAVACTSSPTRPRSSTDASIRPSPSIGEPTPSPSEVALTSVRISPPGRGSFLVHGTYPHVESRCKRSHQPTLAARYPGTLSIRRSDDGTLSLTVTLPFERYLQGIAEVPPSWPMAALEAQAIAARSYALATTGWSGQEGDTLDTPICATTSCQVYGGIPLEPSASIGRWYRAVRRTSGRVLLYQGRPADTVYFSTSNGHTYGNEDVFGSAPLPYLRPVIERDDGASPTSHWSVRIPFDDLARFLGEAGEWPGGRTISGVRLDGGNVVVEGGGITRSIDLSTFRDAVNVWAPCLEPGRYPPAGLPTTIPSKWLTLSAAGDAVTTTGRGWGHGVGMVQWGAYGKARRGLSASQILAFYYGGLRPEPYPEPGLIHVQVAGGLTSLRIVPSRAGADLNGEPLARGRVLITGGDRLKVQTP